MIVIIPCGKAKKAYRTIAGAMYVGNYHRACMRYAWTLTTPDHIYILSSKYGLLALTDEIDPYELYMGQQGSITTEQVRKQAQERNLLLERVVALGGRSYTSVCKAIWPACLTPLEGVGGMGAQISWMTQQWVVNNREETS